LLSGLPRTPKAQRQDARKCDVKVDRHPPSGGVWMQHALLDQATDRLFGLQHVFPGGAMAGAQGEAIRAQCRSARELNKLLPIERVVSRLKYAGASLGASGCAIDGFFQSC
jgi:hypothetical protein